MAQEPNPLPVEARRRIPPLRVAVSVAIALGLLMLSLLYHDGVLATQPLDEATDDGASYRLRGRVADVTPETFRLTDGADSVVVLWNLTRPESGAQYVVSGVYDAQEGALDGHALVRVWMPWPGFEPGTFGL